MTTVSFIIDHIANEDFTEHFSIECADADVEILAGNCVFNTRNKLEPVFPGFFRIDLGYDDKSYMQFFGVSKIVHNGKEISFEEFAKDESIQKFVLDPYFRKLYDDDSVLVNASTKFISIDVNRDFYLRIE